MTRHEVIENPGNSPNKDNNPVLKIDWLNKKVEGFGDDGGAPNIPKNDNKLIAELHAGEQSKIDNDHMHLHPAEKTEGVHHMIVAKWDENTSTKFGYDANNQLITTTMVYGDHPARIERLLDEKTAKMRSKDKNAKAGWYEVPHGLENKEGVKPSETTNHFYSEREGTYIFSHGKEDDRGTVLTLGKKPEVGNFTERGPFAQYDADGDIISLRNMSRWHNGISDPAQVFTEKNGQIIPHYRVDKKGNPIKVDGHKVVENLSELGAEGQLLHTWDANKDTDKFSRNSGDTTTELWGLKNSKNGLEYIPIPPPPPLNLPKPRLADFPKQVFASDAADKLPKISVTKSETTPVKAQSLDLPAGALSTLNEAGKLPKISVTESKPATEDSKLPDLPAKQDWQWFDKKDIPKDMQLADNQTGVHIERAQVVHLADGDIIAGYNEKNEQVLLKAGNGLYINPNDSERAALGKPNGKAGWYRNDGYLSDNTKIRKMPNETYGIWADHSFVTGDAKDPNIGRVYAPNKSVIEGKYSANGTLVESNAGGTAKSLRLSDHSVLALNYANEKDPTSLKSFAETTPAGAEVAWTKIANTANDFESKDIQGNKHIRRNVQLVNNDHLSYTSEHSPADKASLSLGAAAMTTDTVLKTTSTDSSSKKQESQWLEKKDIPESMQLADNQTGVHIERIQMVHLPAGDFVAGYNEKNEQVLLKAGNGLYINPNDSERAALGQPNGKAGWYINDGYLANKTQIRKMPDENYGIWADHSFVSRDAANPSIGVAYLPNGDKIKGRCTATGALVESNDSGAVKSVRRADHTVLTAQYANEKDLASLNSLEETDNAGYKVTWTKIANTANDFESKDASGHRHIRSNVQLASNGNLSYIDAKDTINKNNPITTIVRSNGVELKTGINLSKYAFDGQGRFSRIQVGDKVREFSYLNDQSEAITEIRYPTTTPNIVFVQTRVGNSEEWNYDCYRYFQDDKQKWWRQAHHEYPFTNPQQRDGSWPPLRGWVSVDKNGNYTQQLFAVSH